MKKTVQQVAQWLGDTNTFDANLVVTGISINTRTLQPGDLFIPFKGESVNGHKYVKQAFEAGAVATLWQKDEPNMPTDVPVILVDDAEEALQTMAKAYRQTHQATFIGITGSNGKTSTKDLVAGTLSPYYKVQKTEGNFNNQLGLPLTILSLDEDTQFAILEMGMDGYGQIELLTKLARPHHVVITNIGEAHMEALGSRAGIAKAKFEIIQGLQENGKLFYDGDEPLLQELVAKESQLETVSFGFGTSNAMYADAIEADEFGSRFTTHGLIEGNFMIQVLGSHQVKNTLAAIGIAQAVGLSNNQIEASLKNVSLTNMRMQLVNGHNDILFINDAYNAAPTSVRAALQFVATTNLRKDKWIVLGDMLELGDLELTYHRELIEAIDFNEVNQICLYGPRMEELYKEIQEKQPQANVLWTPADYEPIIQLIEKQADAHTLILLKGSRGMALETILNKFQ
ncbi:MAG: UDP-N-acetylmuramoyl-tripeptide--D-alanyl-D-alanine ligase [Kurthia sp.]|nr:UDP-N-acetylmuramoyl-tripeptide--D-alanyl-D-alanine ligase [Candidatus Kurthia equi]